MKILDATGGNRGIWFDKTHPGVTWIDIRKDMHPGTLLMDCRKTSFREGEFDLIVFDPPHMAIGPKAQMAERYGSFSTAYIRELCALAFREFHRILRPDGLLAFKWASHDTSLERVLGMASGFDPLVGTTTASRRVKLGNGHDSDTSWVLLRRANRDPQRVLEAA